MGDGLVVHHLAGGRLAGRGDGDGLGGVAGPMMAGYFKDSAGTVEGWYPAFIIAGVLCIVAVILAMMLKPPEPPRRRKSRKGRRQR